LQFTITSNSLLTQSSFRLYFQDFKQSFFNITPHLPPLNEIAYHCLIALIWREILFYAVHRALHHPRIYAKIHKKHHKFVAPMAFATQYAHPIEQLLGNVMPTVLPLIVMRVHILTYFVFVTLQLAESSSVHSGYDFAGARAHDLHHEKFQVNFGGPLGIMDWLLGTDVEGWNKPKGEKEA
jgi:sterol desaturase/sphingolipid hydroxylase (fatty acid hydroxylase superfamily)